MPPRAYTRVAVVQLACQPATTLTGRAPFEDPLFDMARPDALRPEGHAPEELEIRFRQLRERIARAHHEQLMLKVRAILARCQEWGVRLIVFPEYSLPWQVLGEVALAGGDMVMVAGTHSVTRQGVKSGLYERLGASAPAPGEAVCPVLYRGQLLHLQPKLSRATPETEMRLGKAWRPVDLPEGLPGPMGVLICLDFLHRGSEAHKKLVADSLEQCRFLAVPSYTPDYTADEFSSQARVDARRYGRPVLWADVATFSDKREAGGSSIHVDEGHPADLRRFPEHAGYLEPGDEGVLVADVDLGYERVGSSTRYDEQRPIQPFAAASLVYPARPAGERYTQWLAEAALLLAGEETEATNALADHIERSRTLLLDAVAGSKAHDARVRRLLRDVDSLHSAEQFQRYLREVVLPPEALPLPTLRAVLAGAAADAIFEWQKNWRGFGLGALVQRLHEAAKKVSPPDPGEWSEPGRAALELVRQAVGREPGSAEPPQTALEPEVRWAIPPGIDPAALGEFRHGGFVFRFRPHPENFRPIREGTGHHEENELRSIMEGEVSPGLLEVGLQLFLLTVAETESQHPIASLGIAQEGWIQGALLPITHLEDRWVIRAWDTDRWWKEHEAHVTRSLEEKLGRIEVQIISTAEGWKRLEALLPRFKAAGDLAQALLNQRLVSVKEQFEEPWVRVGEEQLPALQALNRWRESTDQMALVLGDYGSGKSTTLAKWCTLQWKEDSKFLPLLCSLASAPPTRDAHGLLLDAAGTPDTPAHRAALRLLIKAKRLLPVFDGFDEMATRQGPHEMAGRLSELLGVAEDSGRVVVSARTHYFESESSLRSTAALALNQALGASAGLTRLTFQPFTKKQIHGLIQKVLSSPQEAAEAEARIQSTYDLMDLVSRPLLLGMVLTSLHQIAPTARVAPADIYEAYLRDWLLQTPEDGESLTHEQKKKFAEALAEELWRQGASSCSWRELRNTVRSRMGSQLPDHLPPTVIFRDIEGGAFFVREGEEHYRFAHKSFLEYFLARALAETLEAQPERALETRPLTREVAAFLGEVLRRQHGDALESPAVRSLHALLRAGGTSKDTAHPVAANALRLLHGLALWAQDDRRWIPEQADLRGVDLTGEDLRGARLGSALLTGAKLAGVDLSGAVLAGADLSGAVLAGARLEGASLRDALAVKTDFTQADASGCDVTAAALTQAVLTQSVWLGNSWEGTKLGGAAVTAALMAPTPPSAGKLLDLFGVRASLARGHEGAGINSVSFSPDGRRLASAGEDGHVRLWDAESGLELRALSGHNRRVWSVSFSADGRRLASSGDDGHVRLWDAESGRELRALSGHNSNVWSVSFSPDGRRLASAGEDGRVRLWDAESGRANRASGNKRAWIKSVSFSPDGRRLASAGDDGRVRLWDAESGGELRALSGHNRRVLSVCFSPDGRRLASSGADGSVRLWDAESGRELRALSGHNRSAWSVCFSPDGRRLASSGADGSVRLWDAESGRELRVLSGHNRRVRSVCFSPDGRRLASSGADGSVRLWDAESGRELRVLSGHNRSVRSVSFSPDGRRLASAGDDGSVRLWDAESGTLLGMIEAADTSTLVSTPSGYCLMGGDRSRHMLSVSRPERSATVLYLPIGEALRSLLHQPDKVKASLAGRPADPRELAAELAARGWTGGAPWDGEPQRVPESVSPPPPPPQATPPEAISSSPFRPGSALEDAGILVGREATIRELLALVTGRSPTILLGPRRAGKTWLLDYLPKRLLGSYTVHSISLQGRPPRSADNLALLLEPELEESTPRGSSPGAALLRKLGRAAKSKPKSQHVYLLDEVAALSQGDETLFPWLRELGQRHAALVLAGSHWDWVKVIRRANEVSPGSSFGNDFTPVVLEPIPMDEARLFLTETVPGLISKDVADWVLELCGAWPFYLQVMGHALYFANAAGNRKPFNDKTALAELYDQKLLIERSPVFKDRLRELPEAVTKILFTHREQRPEFRTLVPEERTLLVDAGLCTEAGRWLPDKPFFEWIRRHADALDG